MVHQTGGNIHPALHPARILVHRVVLAVCQRHHLQHVIHPVVQFPAAQPVKAAKEEQVGAGGERGVERQVLRHQPDELFHLQGILEDVKPANPRRARSGLQYTRQHGNGGGLSGAVGTQQAEHLALRNVKRNLAHGSALSKILGEILHFQDICHESFSFLMGMGGFIPCSAQPGRVPGQVYHVLRKGKSGLIIKRFGMDYKCLAGTDLCRGYENPVIARRSRSNPLFL